MVQDCQSCDQLSSRFPTVLIKPYDKSGRAMLTPEEHKDLENHFCPVLATEIYQLRKYASQLRRIDPRTESITRQFSAYPNGVIFEPLPVQEGNIRANDVDGTLSFNLETIVKLGDAVRGCPNTAPHQTWMRLACTVFVFHEASHLSQGLGKYRDIKRIKNVDTASIRLGELDLRSDFIAAKTLSLLNILQSDEPNSQQEYIAWLHRIWCILGKALLQAFPAGKKRVKQQRVFGYLLMASIIHDAFSSDRALEFKAELWPEWNDSFTHLTIWSDGNLNISRAVDSDLLRRILDEISAGDYGAAFSDVRSLYGSLPRR